MKSGTVITRIGQFLKKHIVVFITILAMNSLLAILAYQGDLILQEEVYEKNVENGNSKCARTVNSLDNIIYLGENVVNFVERDYRYLTETGNVKALESDLVNETYELINKEADYFMNLYIARNGKASTSSNGNYENSPATGRLWYDLALEREEMVITDPYQDLQSGEYVITISKKIGDDDCVVGLDVAQKKILNVLKEEVELEGAVTSGFIVNQDGIIMAHTNEKYMGLSAIDSSIENIINIEPHFKEIQNNDSGQIMLDNGKDSYALVHQRTASNWHVIYIVNKKVLNDETILYKKQLITTYIVCAFLLNMVLLIYYFKRIKAIYLKERAQKAEQDLIGYKENLEKLVLEGTEEIRIQGERLKELNTTIIDTLADIVEFRDLESGQHIKRIKLFVYILLEKAAQLYPEYAVPIDKIDVICNASALHDIGKIGIPDRILLKPSKLTFDEFEHMKKHTLIGDDLVTRILEKYDGDLVKFSHEICRYHHERYDGKGYPDGLKGDEIPICAQVVGMADVYDALIEKRVYKEAFSHEKAISMIKNGECGVFSRKLIHCLELVEHDLFRASKLYE